jgi:hypothetical protein
MSTPAGPLSSAVLGQFIAAFGLGGLHNRIFSVASRSSTASRYAENLKAGVQNQVYIIKPLLSHS